MGKRKLGSLADRQAKGNFVQYLFGEFASLHAKNFAEAIKHFSPLPL
jgi:hypothetical protein